MEDVEKALNLAGRHTYLYAPAKGEDITTVIKHLHRAGIVVLLLVSAKQAGTITVKSENYYTDWREAGLDAQDAAKLILKHSAYGDLVASEGDYI